ncbi:MAG TPA: CAP domain-containing protein [Nitrolancea sp.]|nr:CAP domain-containing protein [Nitrolancea sp.]
MAWRSLCTRCLLLIVPLLALLAPAGMGASAAPVDETAQALALINSYRAWAGVAPITRNADLDGSASAHARYYQLNYGDPSLSGMGLHAEQPGKPGFTGADMQDRVEAQGYGGWANENIGLSTDLLGSLDWFIGTINHRLTLIDPRYTDIGFGVINDGKVNIEVIDVGAPSWSDTATPEWTAWPPDGTSGVGTSFDGETPDPFPGASYPVGYPITLKYFGPGSVSYSSAKLTANGKDVPLFSATGSGWLTQQTFMIAASDPLQPGTTYTVTAGGSANGAPFTKTWSFQTATPTAHALADAHDFPPGLKSADPAVQNLWWSADGAVAEGWVQQSWLWGPDSFAAKAEQYAGSPGNQRQVYYFDKSRMEISDPGADRSSQWFVTNGLLVREMITGQVQSGPDSFTAARPAAIPLAGDEANNPAAPTYASLTHLTGAVPDQTGLAAINTLAQDGTAGLDGSFAGVTKLGHYDATTGHNVAGVFWDWLSAQGWDPLYVMGRPLSEPYWVRTRVKGVEQPVLVQAFERRVITYTPGNDPDWRVEMGNVGRHYYSWRYGQPPAG